MTRLPARAASDARPSRHAWWRAGGLVLLLALLQITGAATLLRLDATALAHGQVWRLVTAHFVHLGWIHLLLNASGILLCCALAPGAFARGFVWRVGGLALGIGLCLWRFSPADLPYVGFSGVLYGLFAMGLIPPALERDRSAGAALAVVTGWMLWPIVGGDWQAEAALIGGAVISSAHYYGYGLALLALVVLRTRAYVVARTHSSTNAGPR